MNNVSSVIVLLAMLAGASFSASPLRRSARLLSRTTMTPESEHPIVDVTTKVVEEDFNARNNQSAVYLPDHSDEGGILVESTNTSSRGSESSINIVTISAVIAVFASIGYAMGILLMR